MPAGLDGNPAPISTPRRDAVLAALVDRVVAIEAARTAVGLDGAPGSGKSTLADELAERLRDRGHHVVRSTIDSFHRPRAERLARGDTSPEGYYLDSHQLDTATTDLLEPFARGDARIRTSAFDEPNDTVLDEWTDDIPDRSILVFDGIFLHRRELMSHWHLTVLLLAETRRAAGWEAYLNDGLPEEPSARHEELDRRLRRARWPRYQEGWQLYLDTDDPTRRATVVVDNDDLAAPVIVAADAR